ncbi:MAG TPA: S24/S26 family peptidase, partial [Oligoflexia bacterium]|nr:S24/S26 family peptidase [Oligoflexia bacterium]
MIISNIPQPVADAVYDIIREKLAAGIPLRSRVASRSMVPLIVPGDVVSVHSSVPDALRKGDIVAVRAGNQIVVHRFRGRTRQGGRQMLL